MSTCTCVRASPTPFTPLLRAACRLPEVVFENALVIQGNACDELPEQILGSARLYRCDFGRERPYDSFLVPEPLGVHAGQGMQPTIPEQEGEGE